MEAGELDAEQLWAETAPIALLIGMFGAIAIGVFLLGIAVTDVLGFAGAWVGVIATQFVVAVGTGVVVLYIVVRGIRLAER